MNSTSVACQTLIWTQSRISVPFTSHLSPIKCPSRPRGRRTRTSAGLDPGLLQESFNSTSRFDFEDLHDSLTNLLAILADSEVAAEVVQKTTEVATSDAASTVASKSGPLTAIADALEYILKVIDAGLEVLHVPYAFGFSIIILTILVKVVTFPLSKKQVESSIAMQELQPQIKQIQEKYKNNPEEIQQKTSALYQTAGINPLAGCLPTLATIPVFIGLYRGLLNAADQGVLNEGFFLIPSLAGPTTFSARQAGMGLSWLLPLKDGSPPIGWHDASGYLILPFFLVVSQYVSQQVLQSSRSMDPSNAGMQTFMKVLPLLLGWFSLNVPSGLTLYWITNNILTTGQQVYLKKEGTSPMVETPSKPASMVETPSKPASMVETPSKPAAKVSTAEPVIETKAKEVKPTGRELGARRSKKGEKFRARQAREAAKKARKTSTSRRRKKKTQVIQEAPVQEVTTQFEKELTTSALTKEDSENKQEIEPQRSDNLSG